MASKDSVLVGVLADLLLSTALMRQALLKADRQAVSAAIEKQIASISRLDSYPASVWKNLSAPHAHDLIRLVMAENERVKAMCRHSPYKSVCDARENLVLSGIAEG